MNWFGAGDSIHKSKKAEGKSMQFSWLKISLPRLISNFVQRVFDAHDERKGDFVKGDEDRP